MVAMKAPAGSIPFAWVKVATWALVSEREFVRSGDETEIVGSAMVVDAPALLLPELASGLVVDAVALFVVGPSSVVWAVTVAVTRPPALIVPILNVTTP